MSGCLPDSNLTSPAQYFSLGLPGLAPPVVGTFHYCSRYLVVVLLLNILPNCAGRARHQLITQTNCQLSLSLSRGSHLSASQSSLCGPGRKSERAMNFVRILISIVLLTLVFGDVHTRRIKSKSRNSIRKNHQKSKNGKQRKHKDNQENKPGRQKMSRNAFRNSESTKSFEPERMEDFEDEDYFYDAPIIKIKFKRDVNTNFELRRSFLIQKLI